MRPAAQHIHRHPIRVPRCIATWKRMAGGSRYGAVAVRRPAPPFPTCTLWTIPNTRRSAYTAMMLPLQLFLHRASLPTARCHDYAHVIYPSRSGIMRYLHRQTPSALPALPTSPVSRRPEIFVPCPCSWSRRLALITGNESRRSDPLCKEGSEKVIRLFLRKYFVRFSCGWSVGAVDDLLAHARNAHRSLFIIGPKS